MNTIAYLKELYGYNNPIIFKNIRIGGKSKSSIRQELYRAAKRGDIIRCVDGIFFFPQYDNNNEDLRRIIQKPTLSIGDIIKSKYLYEGMILDGLEVNRIGYYSGFTLLNMLGISPQVPNFYEIVTNNTSCKKRTTYINGQKIILRKPKTEITHFNWRALQFLDLMCYVGEQDLKSTRKLTILKEMCKKIGKASFTQCLGFYKADVINKILKAGLFNEIR